MSVSDKSLVIVTDQAGAKTVTAELPTNATMMRLVPAIVAKMGLPTNIQYGIQHKESGKQLRLSDTLTSVGVRDGDTLRLLPNVTAGAIPGSSVPGLDPSSIRSFTVDDLKSSGDAALIMLIKLYEEATDQSKNLRSKLEAERQKSSDRLISTLVLLVSQVLIAIGTNLLTNNQTIPGVLVLAAGVAQALLAIFFTFREPKATQ